MYCKQCGKVLLDEEKFCSSCGNTIENAENTEYEFPFNNTQPTPTQVVEQIEVKEPKYTTATLVLGVLATILSALNYFGIYFVHIIGIILGSIGITLIKQDKAETGKFSKTGRNLCALGVVLGLIAMIVGFIYGFMQEV